MLAINTNNVDTTFLSHNHIFHPDDLKYSQLSSLWHPYSLWRWDQLILQKWILSISHYKMSNLPSPTAILSSPLFFHWEDKFLQRVICICHLYFLATDSLLTLHRYKFQSPHSPTVATVKVTTENYIIKSNEHVSVLILLFRNIWPLASSLILIC